MKAKMLLRFVKNIALRGLFFLRKTAHSIKQYIFYYKNFGASMACVQFKECMVYDGRGYSDYFIEKTSDYMQQTLEPIVRKYSGFLDTDSVPVCHKRYAKVDFNGKLPVWVCWWQGKNQMPPVVKVCYRRVCKTFQNDQTEVVLITEKNLSDYIDFPRHIIEKYQNGLIGKAHFADLLRWGLMANYGGIWLDATVLITYESTAQIKQQMSYPFYTQRFLDESECPNEPSRGLWCNFYFMGAHEGAVHFFQFVYDSLLYYWQKYNYPVHYVFLDYIIWTGYKTIDFIRKLIDDVPPNNKYIWHLCRIMNKPFNENEWTEMMCKNDAYKLTYKNNWKEYDDAGEITFFGHLMQELYEDE